MTSPVETVLAVVGIGGRLTPAGDKLRMFLPRNATPELKTNIRAHKAVLLALVNEEGRDWCLVRSEAPWRCVRVLCGR